MKQEPSRPAATSRGPVSLTILLGVMPSVTALPSDRSSRFYEASGHGKRIAVDYPIGRRFYECIPALLDDPRRLDAMPIVDFAALFG